MSDEDLNLKLLGYVAISNAAHERMEKHPAVEDFETTLCSVIEVIRECTATSDLILNNDIHRACIHFDRERLAKSEKEQEQFDNMLSENESSRESILSLVERPEEYRPRMERAYGPYRKILRPPAKEASIVAYKNISRQLGHLKRGASSKVVKDYFTARQDLLRADLDLIVDLQCKALGLEAPAKSKNAVQSKGMSLER